MPARPAGRPSRSRSRPWGWGWSRPGPARPGPGPAPSRTRRPASPSPEEPFGKGLRVERKQIAQRLAHADVADGDAQLAHDRHRHPALGRAVELREHEPGDAGGPGELA